MPNICRPEKFKRHPDTLNPLQQTVPFPGTGSMLIVVDF